MRNGYAVVALMCIALAWSPAFGAVFYGAQASETPEGDIYLIDTSVPSCTLLFDTGLGIGWYGATDSDVSHSFYVTAGGGPLYLIDVAALSATLVGDYVTGTIMELAYNEATDVLYGTDYDILYQIDKSTAVATPIGPHGVRASYWAMDYDGSIDELVAVNHDDGNTYYIDMNTGAASYVGPTGQGRVTDIWYDHSSGDMYGVGNVPSQVYSMDSTTGALSILFAIDANILGLGGPFVSSPVVDTTWGRIKSLYR